MVLKRVSNAVGRLENAMKKQCVILGRNFGKEDYKYFMNWLVVVLSFYAFTLKSQTIIEWQVNGVVQEFPLLNGNPVILNPGNNYRISFQNLNYLGSYIGDDTFQTADAEILYALENGWGYAFHKVKILDTSNPADHYFWHDLRENPDSLLTNIIGGVGAGDPPYWGGVGKLIDEGFSTGKLWDDLNGQIYFEVTGGSMQLDGISIVKYTTTDRYGISLVPEPSAFSLLAVGLGGLAMMRRRRS